ncbi:MAG: MXAN_5187 C-terminal domain-containing protein [Anaeromyxobacteraceae bacterium]
MAVPPRIPGKPGLPRPGAAPPQESEADALARAKREKEQLSLEVKEIEEELERVKARYDQYFLGYERREPKREQGEIRKRVMIVKDAFTRNAALKFRIQSLHARYLAYERLWVRSAREKEEGTYRRDLFKARLRSKDAPAEQRPPTPAGGTPAQAAPSPASAAPLVAAAPPKPAPVAAAATPKPAASPVPAAPRPAGVDPKVKQLFDQYVAAKRQCGEDVSKISLDAVARTVAKQTPELMARFKAKAVDFRVEVKDGRAVLKAIPKV